MKTKANNGLTAEELGATAYAVFAHAFGAPLRTWDQLGGDQAPWCDVAVMAIGMLDLPADEQAETTISAKRLAEDLYAQHQAANGNPPDWAALPERAQLGWEAVGRHLLNVIDADGGDLDVAAMEEKMAEWIDSRQPASIMQ